MGKASTAALTGSLAFMMDKLVELEQDVHSDLRVYRYRPRTPDLPCLWNWIQSAPFELMDQQRFRDNITVLTQIGIAHTDVDEEMAKLEEYADAFRTVIDPALHTIRPLGAKWAKRDDMRMVSVDFGELGVLAVEFPILIQLDRQIVPQP